MCVYLFCSNRFLVCAVFVLLSLKGLISRPELIWACDCCEHVKHQLFYNNNNYVSCMKSTCTCACACACEAHVHVQCMCMYGHVHAWYM